MKYFAWFFLGFIVNPVLSDDMRTVRILTASQACIFTAEIARTPQQQATGLMYRRHLPPLHGMLFVYSQPQIVTFWMKNTFIPLDILFINSNYKIVNIHENAKPFSLHLISSKVPVIAVLELFAGSVDQYNIKLNQQVKIATVRKNNHDPTSHH